MSEDLKRLISPSASRVSKIDWAGTQPQDPRTAIRVGIWILATVEARTKQGVAERELDWQSANTQKAGAKKTSG